MSTEDYILAASSASRSMGIAVSGTASHNGCMRLDRSVSHIILGVLCSIAARDLCEQTNEKMHSRERANQSKVDPYF